MPPPALEPRIAEPRGSIDPRGASAAMEPWPAIGSPRVDRRLPTWLETLRAAMRGGAGGFHGVNIPKHTRNGAANMRIILRLVVC